MSQTELIAVVGAVVVLLLSLVALRSWLKTRRAIQTAADEVNRLNAVTVERALVIKRAEQIGKTLEAGTQAVALGTDVVQSTHGVIASSVFGILDAIPQTKQGAGAAREVHDATAEGVYTAISEVNKAVGGLLKGLTNPSARQPQTPPPSDQPKDK
ncbi:hypothetical protein [Smaragdicoccus niigatensis]|uniref:hypothetical protein n=1 Tax=Smaragdicoccus niigatensis TaxID=359359 RepID=UPI000374A2A2|nr:hypothetical protein [Smaragdicoccus niigatensis]